MGSRAFAQKNKSVSIRQLANQDAHFSPFVSYSKPSGSSLASTGSWYSFRKPGSSPVGSASLDASFCGITTRPVRSVSTECTSLRPPFGRALNTVILMPTQEYHNAKKISLFHAGMEHKKNPQPEREEHRPKRSQPYPQRNIENSGVE